MVQDSIPAVSAEHLAKHAAWLTWSLHFAPRLGFISFDLDEQSPALNWHFS
jgi:hypothetical protein